MKSSQVHNRKEVEDRRKDLRKRLTPAEAALWTLIKDKQIEGRKFRRQHSVGKYILDFYCPSEHLAIELDGEHHFTDEGSAYDQDRTNYLNSLQIRVIRFENEGIFQSPEAVIAEIRKQFKNDDSFKHWMQVRSK